MPSTTFPKIDFSKLPKLEMPEIDTDRVVETSLESGTTSWAYATAATMVES